jgi:transposase-like protein
MPCINAYFDIMDSQQTRLSRRSRHQLASPHVPASTALPQFKLETLTSRQLAFSTGTEEETFAMGLQLGIISLEPGDCLSCYNPVSLIKDASRVGGSRFCCSCIKSFSVLTNTLFDGLNLKIWQVLTLAYHFCSLEPVTKAAQQCEVTEGTVCNWYNYLRSVQAAIMSNLAEQQIGGSGHVIEIDEFHCFTPKYNKGRTLAKGAIWGFGGIDVNTRDVF